jgi:hypothetical protein
MTVRGLAKRWRVSPAKVRHLVRRGVLVAFDTGTGLRISPEAVRAAEAALAVPAAGGTRRPRRQDRGIDRSVIELLESGA